MRPQFTNLQLFWRTRGCASPCGTATATRQAGDLRPTLHRGIIPQGSQGTVFLFVDAVGQFTRHAFWLAMGGLHLAGLCGGGRSSGFQSSGNAWERSRRTSPAPAQSSQPLRRASRLLRARIDPPPSSPSSSVPAHERPAARPIAPRPPARGAHRPILCLPTSIKSPAWPKARQLKRGADNRPSLSMPCHTKPSHALPRHAKPCPDEPGLAVISLPSLAMPQQVVPRPRPHARTLQPPRKTLP